MVTKLHTDDIFGYTGIGALHPNNQTPFYMYTWNDGNYIFNKDGSKAIFQTENRAASKKILEFPIAIFTHTAKIHRHRRMLWLQGNGQGH